MLRPPPCSTLFPYTTLFRSIPAGIPAHRGAKHRARPASDAFDPRFGIDNLLPRRLLAGASQINMVQSMRAHLETRSEEHTSELQSRENLVCRLLLEKKKQIR